MKAMQPNSKDAKVSLIDTKNIMFSEYEIATESDLEKIKKYLGAMSTGGLGRTKDHNWIFDERGQAYYTKDDSIITLLSSVVLRNFVDKEAAPEAKVVSGSNKNHVVSALYPQVRPLKRSNLASATTDHVRLGKFFACLSVLNALAEDTTKIGLNGRGLLVKIGYGKDLRAARTINRPDQGTSTELKQELDLLLQENAEFKKSFTEAIESMHRQIVENKGLDDIYDILHNQVYSVDMGGNLIDAIKVLKMRIVAKYKKHVVGLDKKSVVFADGAKPATETDAEKEAAEELKQKRQMADIYGRQSDLQDRQSSLEGIKAALDETEAKICKYLYIQEINRGDADAHYQEMGRALNNMSDLSQKLAVAQGNEEGLDRLLKTFDLDRELFDSSARFYEAERLGALVAACYQQMEGPLRKINLDGLSAQELQEISLAERYILEAKNDPKKCTPDKLTEYIKDISRHIKPVLQNMQRAKETEEKTLPSNYKTQTVLEPERPKARPIPQLRKKHTESVPQEAYSTKESEEKLKARPVPLPRKNLVAAVSQEAHEAKEAEEQTLPSNDKAQVLSKSEKPKARPLPQLRKKHAEPVLQEVHEAKEAEEQALPSNDKARVISKPEKPKARPLPQPRKNKPKQDPKIEVSVEQLARYVKEKVIPKELRHFYSADGGLGFNRKINIAKLIREAIKKDPSKPDPNKLTYQNVCYAVGNIEHDRWSGINVKNKIDPEEMDKIKRIEVAKSCFMCF